MILCQALHFDTAVDTAKVVDGFHSYPLRGSKVIDRGTLLACMPARSIRTSFVWIQTTPFCMLCSHFISMCSVIVRIICMVMCSVFRPPALILLKALIFMASVIPYLRRMFTFGMCLAMFHLTFLPTQTAFTTQLFIFDTPVKVFVGCRMSCATSYALFHKSKYISFLYNIQPMPISGGIV